MEAVDRAVLERLGNILTPDLVDDIVGRVRELAESNDSDARVDRARQELATAELQVEKYAAAIGQAGNVSAVVRFLQEAEQQRVALVRELERLEAGSGVVRVDWRLVERQARRRLAQWRSLLARRTIDARDVLRVVLVAPLRFTPFRESTRRGFRFQGDASVAGLLDGVLESCRGKWRPHRQPVTFGASESTPASGQHEVGSTGTRKHGESPGLRSATL